MNHLATSKEDILAASRDLIKENGWAAVSIRAVASRCSVSAGTIYNYYDGYYGLSPKNNIISNNNIIIDSTRDVIGIYIAMADNTIIRDNNIKLTAGNIAYGVYNIYSPDFKVFMCTIWTANTKIIHNFIDA